MAEKVKIVPFVPLSLYANHEEGNGYASLTWSIRMGYPRVTVYTDNNDTDSEFSYKKLIIAPFDAITVNIFINKFKEVINSTKETKFAIQCFNVKYEDNVKTTEVGLQATVICGKTTDGVIYLSVVAEGKDRVVITLMPNEKWHKLLDENDEVVTDKRILSKEFATAYHARLKALMDKYMLDDTIIKHTDKKV